MVSRFRLGRLALALAICGAVAAAGSIAYASIPDASGVIHGCYSANGAKGTGGAALSIVDDSSANCGKNLQPITWNQTGPQGPQGVQGAQGPQGPAGPGVAAVATIGLDPNGNVTVDPNFSRGVTLANVTHPQTGVFCIGRLSFQPLVAVGNGRRGLGHDANGNIVFTKTDTIVTANVIVPVQDPDPNVDTFLYGCTDTDQVEVLVYSAAQGTLVDRGFNISLEN
jgi:hypothetical protein